MVIPEEQPAQPALPIQPQGMRVVCGHCGNTFLVRKKPSSQTLLSNHRVVHSEFSCAVLLYEQSWELHIYQQDEWWNMVKVYFTVDAVKKFIKARSWAHIKVSAMFLFLLNEMKTNMLPTVSGRLCCLQAAGGMHSAACFLSLPDSSRVLSTTDCSEATPCQKKLSLSL